MCICVYVFVFPISSFLALNISFHTLSFLSNATFTSSFYHFMGPFSASLLKYTFFLYYYLLSLSPISRFARHH